ncbi:MAG: tetratricopeptide repeat protein [Bacteroidota bacterium]
MINKAIELHDAGNYDSAILFYQSIPQGDTNYMWSLSELTYSYNAAGQNAKAIETGLYALTYTSAYKGYIYTGLGNAYDEAGFPDKAIETYEKGIALFPYRYLLHYNYGVTLYDQGKYKKAQQAFETVLKINPFHAGSHRGLARTSILQGHRTKAMLSMLMYLALVPNDRTNLANLENLVNNAIREESTIKPFSNNTGFEDLDLLVKSKAALDERFEPLVDFNAAFVKQTELVFEMMQADPNSDDLWMRFYVPFFKKLHQQELTPAFLYFLLSSTRQESVSKWLTDNGAEKDKMIQLANDEIPKFKENHKTNFLGEEKEYRFWYFDSGELNAIGNENAEEQKIGQWVFFYSNGQISARGEYDNAGGKIGKWVYYHRNGALSREEEYDKAGNFIKPAKYYFDNGALSHVAQYKDNQLHGSLDYYYECGNLKDKYPYNLGKEEGKGEYYYKTGQKKIDYVIKDGKLDGEYVTYHQSGEIETKYSNKAGKAEGTYTSYYTNGQINEQGQYVNDEGDGKWVGYHEDGEMSYEGTMKASKRIGQWKYYHKNGQLRSEESLDEEGEFDKETPTYDEDGKLVSIYTYDHGKLIAYKHFDKEGKVLSEASDENGNFDLKAYYANGQLYAEGKYTNGELNGLMRYYNPKNGALEFEIEFKDNKYDGFYKEYYASGVLKSSSTYQDGELHGYLVDYHENGKKAKEGWMLNDMAEQTWRFYYVDGTMSEENYYLNGKINGPDKAYDPNGVLEAVEHYDNGTITSMVRHDSTGQAFQTIAIPHGTAKVMVKTPNGNTRRVYDLNCGENDGNFIDYYDNGKVDTERGIENGEYHGPYTSYWEDGSIALKGQYKNGQADGLWTWYYQSGKIKSEIVYKNNERNGKYTHYYENGQVESVCDYVDNKRSGVCQYFSMDGQLQYEKLYDKKHGAQSFRYKKPSGSFSPFQQIIKEGEFVQKTYYVNGKVSTIVNYKNGLYHGKQKYFHSSGKLSEERQYNNGVIQGSEKTYFPNGKLLRETAYLDDKEHGLEKEFYSNGKPKRITTYKSGNKHGEEIKYDQNGKVISRLYYRNGSIY